MLWLNLGTHHIPRAEDSRKWSVWSCLYCANAELMAAHTLTNVATSYLLLTPYNYNDYDVSMECVQNGEMSVSVLTVSPCPYRMQNAVLINMAEPGQSWRASGDIPASTCIPRAPGPFTYSGAVDIYGEEGFQAMDTEVVREGEQKQHRALCGWELTLAECSRDDPLVPRSAVGTRARELVVRPCEAWCRMLWCSFETRRDSLIVMLVMKHEV